MMDKLNIGILSNASVKHIRQTQIAECGLACLAMISNFHGLEIDLGTLRRRFSPSVRGASLKSMIGIADSLLFTSRAIRLPLENISKLRLPAILHWDLNHFVVVERADKHGAFVHDPAKGSAWIETAELSRHFTGIALELQPAPDFRPADQRQRLYMRQLWQRMTGLKRAVAQTIILSLVLEAFVVASPYFMQTALDVALPAHDASLLSVLAVGFGLFALINAGASLLRSFVLLSAGTSVGYGISVNVARRLLRLPVEWFERRSIGDVMWRFQSIAPIQQLLTQEAVATVIDGLFAIFTLALMFIYSPTLTVVSLTALALYFLVKSFSFKAQESAQEEILVTGGKENSLLVETLRGIVTFRILNKEAQRLSIWQSRFTDYVNSQIKLNRIKIWQETANRFIFSIEGIASTWIVVTLVMTGEGFSIGMAFAFSAYKTQFLTKSASLVDKWVSFRMVDLHLERLSDIALAEEDHGYKATSGAESFVVGRIELRDIKYRYSETDPWVLNGVNLVVERGDHIAITGPSGGGKSTLVKVLTGLVEPTSGTLLVDGIPVHQFGYRNYQKNIGTVLQDDTLFTGSLVENITMFDDEVDMLDVENAAKAASIHDDILNMPMRYDSLVGDMGSALSGGQKQRILLARALYRRPKILIVDEGTAHLDRHHEQRVNEAISLFGITRIIVAHRAETLASARVVFELRNGQIADSRRQPGPIEVEAT